MTNSNKNNTNNTNEMYVDLDKIYQIKYWLTEGDREEGFSRIFIDSFNSKQEAIMAAKKIVDRGDAVSVEVFDVDDVAEQPVYFYDGSERNCPECEEELGKDGRCYNPDCDEYDPLSQYFDDENTETVSKHKWDKTNDTDEDERFHDFLRSNEELREQPEYKARFEFFKYISSEEQPPYCITRKDEAHLLKMIFFDGEFIGRGSSRAVFRIAEGIVAKVCIDDGGRKQNQLEIQAFEDLAGVGLAKIYMYSRSIVVMEEVIALDTECITNLLEFDYPDSEEDEDLQALGLSLEGYDELTALIEHLQEYFGHTADNYQVGLNKDGEIVAYDYGFSAEEDRWSQISEGLDYISDDLEDKREIVFHIM